MSQKKNTDKNVEIYAKPCINIFFLYSYFNSEYYETHFILT